MGRRLAIPCLVLVNGACGALLGIDDRAVEPPSADASTPTPPNEDSGSEPTPDAASFCGTVDATLCHDFDLVTDPFAGWSTKSVYGGDTATLDPSSAPPSAPNALRIQQPATASGDVAAGLLIARVDRPSWPAARLSFRVFFSQAAWKPEHRNVAIAALWFTTAAGEKREVYVIVAEAALQLSAKLPTFQAKTATERLPLDRWVALALEVSAPNAPNANAVQTKLTVDESVVLDGAFTAGAAAGAGNVELRLGLDNFNPPEPAFDVRYDNVVLDLK